MKIATLHVFPPACQIAFIIWDGDSWFGFLYTVVIMNVIGQIRAPSMMVRLQVENVV